MSTPRSTPRAVPMGCVTSDLVHLLMPATDALKVVALLSQAQAVRVEQDWPEGRRNMAYAVAPDPLRLAYVAVRADQVVMPASLEPGAHRAAGRPLSLR